MSVAAYTSSPFVAAIEPITDSDDEIRAFLQEAEVPPLLPALAYATGDLSLLKEHLRPDPLLAAMEPIMIVFLGVVVGGMIIAMYLPIFDMMNAVQ